MTAFLGSWFLAYLLGGGLILAVIIYALFFSKKPLVFLAFSFIAGLLQGGANTIHRQFSRKRVYKVV